MSLLRLVSLGFGLIILTLVFGTIFVSKKMRRRKREKALLRPVPWQPDLSQSPVTQPQPAQLRPPYVGVTQERYVMDTEQGYVWTR
jgi:hypothetical protein